MIRMFSMIAFITLHLELGKVLGFPVTLGAIIGTLLLAYFQWGARFSKRWVIGTSFLLAAISLNGVVNSDKIGTTDFLGTYSLIAFTLIMSLMSSGSSKVEPAAIDGVGLAARDSLYAIAIFSVMQSVSGALGSQVLFNPWGGMQYLYHYVPALESNSLPRAQGFYLEPSYNAFVLCTLFAIVFLAGKFNKCAALALVSGLIVTRSATATTLVITLATFALIFFGKKRSRTFTLLGLGFLVVGPELVNRLSTITQSGSSGNYRILAPLKIVGDTLISFPLGAPLGSIYTTVQKYGFLNGASAGASLDNGIYVIIFYLGWVGLALILASIPIVALQVKKMSGAGTPYLGLVAPWIFGSLFFSGGVFLPEYVFLTCLLSLILKYKSSDFQTHTALT